MKEDIAVHACRPVGMEHSLTLLFLDVCLLQPIELAPAELGVVFVLHSLSSMTMSALHAFQTAFKRFADKNETVGPSHALCRRQYAPTQPVAIQCREPFHFGLVF